MPTDPRDLYGGLQALLGQPAALDWQNWAQQQSPNVGVNAVGVGVEGAGQTQTAAPSANASQIAQQLWDDLNAYDERLHPGENTWVDTNKAALMSAFQLNPNWVDDRDGRFGELHHSWDQVAGQGEYSWITPEKAQQMNKYYADRLYETIHSYFGGQPVYYRNDIDTAADPSRLSSILGWENLSPAHNAFATTVQSGAGLDPGYYDKYGWWYM